MMQLTLAGNPLNDTTKSNLQTHPQKPNALKLVL
ncbi:unnamed protein product [Anisakis simplex]|uniref:Uncharacterized protein n=1 Tax=Anisakis simplex TaxID=6269 RepID=A0A3P6PGD7_ANISI|nr:unnamed protein product [Anisakis simplex]